METQTTTLSEIIVLILFLGSIVYLLGATYQVFALIRFNRLKIWYKIFGIVFFTRIATIALTIILWKIVFQNTEIMFGPILLPAIIAEIVLSPLILKIFGFRVLKK